MAIASGPKIAEPKTSPKAVIAQAKELGVKMVDLKFIDMPGLWQHFSIPVDELVEDLFTEGIGFDGSSIRGFQKIHESDMLLLPDPDTSFLDPACTIPTLSIICDVTQPGGTRERYTRDPRFIAKKAEAFLTESGIATTAYFGPEIEFYIFNSIRFGQDQRSGFYEIDSEEGIWNSSKNSAPNLGYRPRYKEGYFPVPPMDKLQDLRSEIVLELQKVGVKVEIHHHEVGTAGQTEIDMRFTTLVKMADQVMKYKYVVKNVCNRNGYTATFMPKPLFGDNGSGMHTHQSLWNEDTPLFYDKNGYALISEMGRHYIGGLLKHAPSILGFAAPTTNSYRRLVPGYEAPINLVYSQRNRSACVRIPTYSSSPKARRLEFRAPDPSCNPCLAFAVMLMAGLDGVTNKIEPPDPIDEDLYEMLAHNGTGGPKVQSTPGSLPEVLNALEEDHDYLTHGGVFTEDLIEEWISFKREREVDPVALRPHPYEFHLYYDI
jgi:glutamine synthetase